MKLSADKQSVSLSISGDLSASQIEALIADLAEIRFAMQPEVSMAIPELGENTGGKPNLSLMDDPEMTVMADSDGGIRLWLRHLGFGWLAFDFSSKTSADLRDYLALILPGKREVASVFSDSFGKGNPQQ